MSPRHAVALLVAATLTACVAPGAEVPDEESVGLQQPTFAPLSPTPSTTPSDDVSASPAPVVPSPSRSGAPGTSAPTPAPTASEVSREPTATPTATPRPVRGVLFDGTGDMEGLQAGQAPDHADLRELTLHMGAEEGRITLAFAAPAPEAADGDQILNVATYHDVSGDGNVDYEIWASLTSEGWGTSWYDLRAGTARFAAEDEVDVEVVDGVVVLTFPPSHLDDARSGRWLASSEWGTALTMSSGTSATDDAPDDRSGAAWPT